MFVKKQASKIDIKNRALQSLQQGANPYGVAVQFIDDMGREDPSFGTSSDASLVIGASRTTQMLTDAINNIQIDDAIPPQMGQTPVVNTPLQNQPEIAAATYSYINGRGSSNRT